MLADDVSSIKEGLAEVFTLTKDSNIPPGLKRIIQETFQQDCANQTTNYRW